MFIGGRASPRSAGFIPQECSATERGRIRGEEPGDLRRRRLGLVRLQGRLPDLIANGKLCTDIGFPQIDPKTDRAMICGGPAMLKDMRAVLDAAGFTISTGIGHAGDYVIERAFVEK